MSQQFPTGTPVKFTITPKTAAGRSVQAADGLTDVDFIVSGPASSLVAPDNSSVVVNPSGAGIVTVAVTATNKLGVKLSESLSVEFVDVVETLNLAVVSA